MALTTPIHLRAIEIAVLVVLIPTVALHWALGELARKLRVRCR